MTTSKHTPAPWRASEMIISKNNWKELNDKQIQTIVKRGADVIACVWCGDDRDGEELANARLIAAAPDLLDALIQIKNQILELKGESSVIDEDILKGDAWKCLNDAIKASKGI